MKSRGVLYFHKTKLVTEFRGDLGYQSVLVDGFQATVSYYLFRLIRLTGNTLSKKRNELSIKLAASAKSNRHELV